MQPAEPSGRHGVAHGDVVGVETTLEPHLDLAAGPPDGLHDLERSNDVRRDGLFAEDRDAGIGRARHEVRVGVGRGRHDDRVEAGGEQVADRVRRPRPVLAGERPRPVGIDISDQDRLDFWQTAQGFGVPGPDAPGSGEPDSHRVLRGRTCASRVTSGLTRCSRVCCRISGHVNDLS